MPLKHKWCKGCKAAFIPETREQRFCNECSQINPKHTLTHRKSKKNEKQ